MEFLPQMSLHDQAKLPIVLYYHIHISLHNNEVSKFMRYIYIEREREDDQNIFSRAYYI